MGIFWKREKSHNLSARQERLANRLAGKVMRYQTRVAVYLNRKTAYWNKASKLMLLALIVFLLGGFSLYQFIQLFTN